MDLRGLFLIVIPLLSFVTVVWFDFCTFSLLVIDMRDDGTRGDLVALLAEVDKAEPLGSSTDNLDVGSFDTDSYSASVDDHQVVIVGYGVDSHEAASLVGYFKGSDALTATTLDAILFELRAFAEATLGEDEDVLGIIRIDRHKANRSVVLTNIDALDTHTRTTYAADGILLEAESPAVGSRKDEML